MTWRFQATTRLLCSLAAMAFCSICVLEDKGRGLVVIKLGSRSQIPSKGDCASNINVFKMVGVDFGCCFKVVFSNVVSLRLTFSNECIVKDFIKF